MALQANIRNKYFNLYKLFSNKEIKITSLTPEPRLVLCFLQSLFYIISYPWFPKQVNSAFGFGYWIPFFFQQQSKFFSILKEMHFNLESNIY